MQTEAGALEQFGCGIRPLGRPVSESGGFRQARIAGLAAKAHLPVIYM